MKMKRRRRRCSDEEAKKVNDKEPFVYCRDLGWAGADDGDLHVVVEKRQRAMIAIASYK